MERFVIALTRTCGSGGSSISKILADYLEINMYDRKLLRLASDDSGINEELFLRADEETKGSLLYKVSQKVYTGELISPESNNFVSDQNLFNYQAKILKQLAEEESYICVGRACDYILRHHKNIIKVFIYASHDTCVKREMERQGVSEKEAAKFVKANNRFRKEYYKYHTGETWESPFNYDICLNTDQFTYEQCAESIIQLVNQKFKTN